MLIMSDDLKKHKRATSFCFCLLGLNGEYLRDLKVKKDMG